MREEPLLPASRIGQCEDVSAIGESSVSVPCRAMRDALDVSLVTRAGVLAEKAGPKYKQPRYPSNMSESNVRSEADPQVAARPIAEINLVAGINSQPENPGVELYAYARIEYSGDIV